MLTDGQGTKRHRNIAEKFNRLNRVHERYRQTEDRQTDGRATANSERERAKKQPFGSWRVSKPRRSVIVESFYRSYDDRLKIFAHRRIQHYSVVSYHLVPSQIIGQNEEW